MKAGSAIMTSTSGNSLPPKPMPQSTASHFSFLPSRQR